MAFNDFRKALEEKANAKAKEDADYQRRLEEAKLNAIEEAKKRAEQKAINPDSEYIDDSVAINYDLYGIPLHVVHGNRGRHLFVYEDFVVIKVKTTVGSLITGNATDGEKVIFLSDCIGLQLKEPGATIGYIQIETASTQMNNVKSGWYNENTFTFDIFEKPIQEVYKYLFNRVREIKTSK